MGNDPIYIPTFDRYLWYLLGTFVGWLGMRASDAAASDPDMVPLLINSVVV
jgi:hypothetical protein